jgi:phage/plasmid-associated DNA primase
LKKLGEVSFRKGIIEEIRTMLESETKFNTQANVISFKNGVYELDTGLFRDRVQRD